MRRITNELVASGAVQKLIPGLVREDVRFHLAIISAAKNDLMKKEILRLHLINRVVSGPNPPGKTATLPDADDENRHRRAVLASHGAIYKAIADGDAAEAKHQ